MNVLFHPDAELEFNEAVDYYEGVESGLGLDFSIEIANAIARITAFPKAWPVIEDGIRRALVKRFPYGVLYSEEQEKIYIVAVMHLHRNPGYWKQRI